jgi:hypothetical protein
MSNPTPILPAALRAATVILTKYDPAAPLQPGYEQERAELAAIIQKESLLLEAFESLRDLRHDVQEVVGYWTEGLDNTTQQADAVMRRITT